jgi:hypothetical protein
MPFFRFQSCRLAVDAGIRKGTPSLGETSEQGQSIDVVYSVNFREAL